MLKGLGNLGDMAKMMKQAQSMQEKVARMQEDLANMPVIGESGAGLVKATATAKGELTGLDFPETGFYFVRVCQAPDSEYQPGGYFLIIYVPAGFQGINVYAWDVINNVPIPNASVNLSGFPGGTTDGSGVVRYPSAGRGSYSASVSAPGGNRYVPLFGTKSVSQTAATATQARASTSVGSINGKRDAIASGSLIRGSSVQPRIAASAPSAATFDMTCPSWSLHMPLQNPALTPLGP